MNKLQCKIGHLGHLFQERSYFNQRGRLFIRIGTLHPFKSSASKYGRKHRKLIELKYLIECLFVRPDPQLPLPELCP